jgi:hypothetical protein
MDTLASRVFELKDDSLKLFSRCFLREWCRGGFSTLSKRDTDVLIFCCLYVSLEENRPKNNYEWAKLLAVTPTKVKSLFLEGYLKFPDILEVGTADAIIEKCFSQIESLSLSVPDGKGGELMTGKVQILIEDPISVFELDRRVKNLKCMYTFERNQEIINLSLKDFLKLIGSISSSEDAAFLEQLIDGQLDNKDALGKLKDNLLSKEYANLSELGKLKKFTDDLLSIFGEKAKKLVGHMTRIFKSQKYQV